LRDFTVSFDVTQEEVDGSKVHHTKEEIITKDRLEEYLCDLINKWVDRGHSFNLVVIENGIKDEHL